MFYMKLAIEQAKIAQKNGEIPIGAIIVNSENVIARAYNMINKPLLKPVYSGKFLRKVKVDATEHLNICEENEIATFCNRSSDPTAHAEMLVIRKACEFAAISQLCDFDMYVTLEPCPMCAQAISFAKIRRLYFGAYNPKGGGVENGPRIFQFCNHIPETYGGILEKECSFLLKDFFQRLRNR